SVHAVRREAVDLGKLAKELLRRFCSPGRVRGPHHEADAQDRMRAAPCDLPLQRLDGGRRHVRGPDQDLHTRLDVEAPFDEKLRVGVDARIRRDRLSNSPRPPSWTSSPSSSIRPPRRRSLTMSQCTALSFDPPRKPKPWPMARWIVPSIFSSKS